MEKLFEGRIQNSIKESGGFTLIELLVVIAIIGILAAMIIANLGTARNKARDASIKGSMDSLRASGELYASDNDETYTGFCLEPSVGKIANAIDGQGSTLRCQDSVENWAACAKLRGDSEKAWCIDSDGERREIISGDCPETFSATVCLAAAS